jgi:hypothetical protein
MDSLGAKYDICDGFTPEAAVCRFWSRSQDLP